MSVCTLRRAHHGAGKRGWNAKRRGGGDTLRRGTGSIADHVKDEPAEAFPNFRARDNSEELDSLFFANGSKLLAHLGAGGHLALLPTDLLDKLLHRVRERDLHVRSIRHRVSKI